MYNTQVRHIATPNVVVGMAVACGGLAQFMAGMWEFPRGNTFGATGEWGRLFWNGVGLVMLSWHLSTLQTGRVIFDVQSFAIMLHFLRPCSDILDIELIRSLFFSFYNIRRFLVIICPHSYSWYRYSFRLYLCQGVGKCSGYLPHYLGARYSLPWVGHHLAALLLTRVQISMQACCPP